MDSSNRSPQLADALAVTTLGAYLLIVVGATTALADATAACQTWPGCNGQWIPTSSEPLLLIAWGHRVAALLVGLLVLGTAILTWRSDTGTKVRAAVAVAVALYPVQVGLGALAATASTPALLSAAHLIVGVGIFAALVVGLAWRLSETTPERAVTADAEPQPNHDATPEAAGRPTVADSGGGIDRGKRIVAAYVSLTKPRLMWLLCLVAAAGMALAAGPNLRLGTVVATLTGGVLAIGASGTFNHVLERDIDRKMARTADRPTATHEIPVRNALAFGFVLTAASLAAFLTVNLLATALGLVAILFYSVVYTLLLKPNTVQNTVIGGFAGALPALIGWAAVTNEIGLPALALAGVIFLWTPAHFYNLAMAYKEDYERGGFPMLPVVRGEAVTRRHVLYYLGATLVGAAALTAIAGLGWLYAATTVAFGAVFLWAVVRLHRDRTRAAAFRAFHASNAYLGALLVVILVEALVL